MTAEAIVREVRDALARHADPDKAARMQAYMKSAMPYWGTPKPLRARLTRDVFRRHPLPDPETWRMAVLALWREAERREERYAAIDLASASAYRAFRTLNALPVFEEMIATGAWWDYTDDVAIHCLREPLERSPQETGARMREWSRDANLWKRRASVICQVNRRRDADLALLFDCIEPNLADREFFIRKAIGWALRSLAWTRLAEVETYVARVGDRLSPLSKHEALKNADKIRAAGGTAKRSGD